MTSVKSMGRSEWAVYGLEAVFVVSLSLLILVVWLIQPPFNPEYGEHRFTNDTVIILKQNLSEDKVGLFEGHEWPGMVPEDEPERIFVSMNQTRYNIFATCTHELMHFELHKDDVNTFVHHKKMSEIGVYKLHNIDPWEIDPRCLKISRHILF